MGRHTHSQGDTGATRSRILAVVGLVAILIVGGWLRLRDLDGSPLWWDEGNNAYFARQSLADVVEMSRRTHDTDPPAHRLALRLWLDLLGDGAYNLRLLSVVCSLGAVIVIYAWGRRLTDERGALLAAALTALSPLQIYYGREAKAYPFVLLFGLLSLYLWARFVHRQRRRRRHRWPALVGVVLTQALTLGAHYYAALIYMAQGLWLLWDAWRHRRRADTWRPLKTWALIQTAVALLLLPWLALTLPTALDGAMGIPGGHVTVGVVAYLQRMVTDLGAGPHSRGWTGLVAMAALGVAAVLGLGRARRRPEVLLLIAVATVPILAGFLTQHLVPFMPARFLLYTMPPLYLAAAVGLRQARLLGVPLLLAVGVAWWAALPAAYTPLAPPEEDLRPIAARLDALARPGDAVVVGYIWQEGNLSMYAPDVESSYYLGWYDAQTAPTALGSLLARHRRLWLVTYDVPRQHPSNSPGWWLEHNAACVTCLEAGLNRACLYTPPREPALEKRARLGAGITVLYGQRTHHVAPGDVVSQGVVWRVDAPPREPHSVYVHLVDAQGALVAQQDGAPVNGLRPLHSLAPGDQLDDTRALLIPPDLPAGRYRLLLGVYRLRDGIRLTTSDGSDHVVLGEVIVSNE